MKLNDWLQERGMTSAEFARRVPTHRATVLRWRKDQRLPSKEMMPRIAELTGGKVRANDFYEAS